MDQDIINQRTGIGVGIGTVVGFVLGGPLGAGIGALVGGGVAHSTAAQPEGVMTPKRKVIFANAMEKITDPGDLRKLASAYASEGLTLEAQMLQKRAALRELPRDTQERRRGYFRKAMASDDPAVIAQVAAAFASQGSVDAAKALTDHAEAVKAAHAAGKSGAALQTGTQEQFANKLGKAIIHFGPDSAQAVAAAKNLAQARGRQPSDALAKEIIRVAANALKVARPAGGDAGEGASGSAGESAGESAPTQAPASPIRIDATTEAANGERVQAASFEETDVAPTGAPEPAAGGAGKVEPSVIQAGSPPPIAVADAAAEGALDPRAAAIEATFEEVSNAPSMTDAENSPEGDLSGGQG